MCREIPAIGQPVDPTNRPHTAAQRNELEAAVRLAATKLDPRISEPVVILVHQEVPRHCTGRIAVRLNAMRADLAVEEKRKLQSEHARLASAVVPTQQKSSMIEPEFLFLEPIEVDQPAAQ